MSLSPGARLGPYEVVSAIGAGGMGEVYRATDTKLKRQVAIKILTPSLAADSDGLRRFQREAEVLASLNHPNIAGIYGLEEGGGVSALVMELVDGEDLAQRIERGPVPIEEALPIGRQIAEALDAAHEQGIIHRDLKPSNVKVRSDGTVKVLDFGLAKAMDPRGASSTTPRDLANTPTITSPAMTQMGMILGTAAYMSPEQARGKPVDKRADIWAFGCVLFEMLSGRRPFETPDDGSVSETLASILRSAPEWGALPKDTPATVRVALRRCLEKDPKRRIRDIADVFLFLDEMADGPSTPRVASTPRSSVTSRLLPLAVVVAVALLVSAAVWLPRPAPIALSVKRLAVVLPDGEQFVATGRTYVALSPDATHLAYVANRQLYLRRLDELRAMRVPGTNGATSPFFSPDGQQIGFWQDGQLRRMAVAGGALQVIGPAANPFGVSWASDGTILFGQGPDGIFRVDADGGTPSVVVQSDPKTGEILYAPELLPDGKTILFTAGANAQASEALAGDDAAIVTFDTESGRRTTIIDGGTQGRFLSPGYLVYARQQALWVVAFDPSTGTRSGSPVSMVEGILQVGSFGVVGASGQAGTAQFATSTTGMLIYVEADAAAVRRTLVWVDRTGTETSIPVPERSYGYPRISPDGRRVALDIRDEGQDIWVLELDSLDLRKLTFDLAPEIAPAWTPDGRHVAFFRSGRGVFWQSADGAGAPERLVEASATVLVPVGFTAKADRLLFHRSTGPGWGFQAIDLPSRKVAEIMQVSNSVSMNSALSPDGRWLAYQAADQGDPARLAIFVRPFPNVDSGLWQLACANCTRPVWSPDGRELFFLTSGLPPGGVASIWSVPVETTPTFRTGAPRKLFEGRYFADLLGRSYDISPDGQRFLMVKLLPAAASRIVVVDNWTEELKRRVPTFP